MSVPDPAVAASAPSIPREQPGDSLFDRLRDWWLSIQEADGFRRWAGSFPLTRSVALRRSRAVFDLCAGFVYSQTLLACVRLGILEVLARGSRTTASLAQELGLPIEATERLMRAARALRLVSVRSGGRWALGALGAPLVGDDAFRALVEHHALVYEDLRDPIAILRARGDKHTALAGYWPYAEASQVGGIDDAMAAPYSKLMATTMPPMAEEVLDAYALDRHRCILDVGGGEGAFLAAAAARHPGLALMLFDLPAVAERARRRLDAEGLADRTRIHAGNFHTDPLPQGADVVSLVRVLLDHADEVALRILRRAREALPAGGTLLVAEPLAGARGAEPVGDAYFGLYLAAMGRGRARRASEHLELMAAAGFSGARVIRTRYPVQTGLIVARA